MTIVGTLALIPAILITFGAATAAIDYIRDCKKYGYDPDLTEIAFFSFVCGIGSIVLLLVWGVALGLGGIGPLSHLAMYFN
jgi:hypothetical protein